MATIKLNNRSPIGLILPIRNGNGGYFDQSFDTTTQIKTNITNLLRTRPGERRMNPLFGTRLYDIVFDQNNDILEEMAENIIREDIGRWIPGVSIKNITSNLLKNEERIANQDIYKLYIAIQYTINAIKQTDSIEITLNL